MSKNQPHNIRAAGATVARAGVVSPAKTPARKRTLSAAELQVAKEAAWDAQIEADSRAGKFDKIFKEAEELEAAGKTIPL
ncbi:MAG: hypothetical protein HAW59_01315 [Betaproteobacteria bacterium]|nr:hypothetical protein [Betaproteobacteria bacterium]